MTLMPPKNEYADARWTIRPPGPAHEDRRRRARGGEGRENRDVEHALEVLERDVEGRAAHVERGIADGDVEPAERDCRVLHGTLRVARTCQIRVDDEGAPSDRLDRGDRLGRIPALDECDVGAERRERGRNSLSDPPARAGYQGDLAVQELPVRCDERLVPQPDLLVHVPSLRVGHTGVDGCVGDVGHQVENHHEEGRD